MGIVQLIDPFYVRLPSDTFRRASIVGQFCWVPVTHLDPIPRLLDVERADPQKRAEGTLLKIRTFHTLRRYRGRTSLAELNYSKIEFGRRMGVRFS